MAVFGLFLERERLAILDELQPGRRDGELYSVPMDAPVDRLFYGRDAATPLDRAVIVLEALGLDPSERDAWCDTVGVDIGAIPVSAVMGPDGKLRPSQ